MSNDYKPDVGALVETMEEQGAKNLAQSIAEAKDKQVLQNIQENMKGVKDAKQKFIDEHRTTIDDGDSTIFPVPYESCDHCYSRGFEGWDHISKIANLCRCITNRFGRKDVKFLTYGELRAIINYPIDKMGLISLKSPDNITKGQDHEVSNQDVQRPDQVNSSEGTEQE